MATIPNGFLSTTIQDLLKPVTSLIPDEVTDIIKGAVDLALDHADPNTPSPAPDAPKPVVAVPDGLRGDVLQGIDTALTALRFLQSIKAIIPDQYEAPIDALIDALESVRTWVD